MKALFAAVLALACVAGSTDGFARGGAAGFAHGGGGLAHRSAPFFAEPAPQMPTFESRIPREKRIDENSLVGEIETEGGMAVPSDFHESILRFQTHGDGARKA